MARTVAIGRQDFEAMMVNHNFYVDKTGFIREWWENDDDITLITRPRRFGKTLAMNMVECFFSVKYAGKGELFSGLNIWEDEKFRKLQGTMPVVSLSFSRVKCGTYKLAYRNICRLLYEQFEQYRFLLDVDGLMSDKEKELFLMTSWSMEEDIALNALHFLSKLLMTYYNKKVIILLDEFDAPLQAAYVHGYWDEIVLFVKGLFDATFKDNPYLYRAILTGITRVSKFSYENSESLFSGLNNLEVVSTTSNKYVNSFGFTQEEVSAALLEFGLEDREDEVRSWYDGFTFGRRTDIYNPWSITNFLDKKQFMTYWANTSDNALVNELVRRGDKEIKVTMEQLLAGGCVRVEIDDHIDFSLLSSDVAGNSANSVWNLLLASGYLKVERRPDEIGSDYDEYDLKITNMEVGRMFRSMIHGWFAPVGKYNGWMKALLADDIKGMNQYMNDVALATFSSFDSGKKTSEEAEPERFYHGFVLGLMVDLADRYVVTSNRESGYGRYDVMLKPKGNHLELPAVVLEFKVYDPEDEKDLTATVLSALRQIITKKYITSLVVEGFPEEKTRVYGFAFEGKKVRIDGGNLEKVEGMIKKAAKKPAAGRKNVGRKTN